MISMIECFIGLDLAFCSVSTDYIFKINNFFKKNCIGIMWFKDKIKTKQNFQHFSLSNFRETFSELKVGTIDK